MNARETNRVSRRGDFNHEAHDTQNAHEEGLENLSRRGAVAQRRSFTSEQLRSLTNEHTEKGYRNKTPDMRKQTRKIKQGF